MFVYFESNEYFEPYTWIWNSEKNFTGGAWPGTALIDVVGVAPSGKNIYRWDYGKLGENVPTGIIFSNHGYPQTSDYPFTNGGYYTEDGLVGVLTQPEPVPGDVNGDGYVNAADVTALYNWILNGDDKDLKNGNQDDDPAINAADVTAVYNIILGINP